MEEFFSYKIDQKTQKLENHLKKKKHVCVLKTFEVRFPLLSKNI